MEMEEFGSKEFDRSEALRSLKRTVVTKINEEEGKEDFEMSDKEMDMMEKLRLVKSAAYLRNLLLTIGLSYFSIGFMWKAIIDLVPYGFYPFEAKNWFYYSVTTTFPRYFDFMVVKWGWVAFFSVVGIATLVEYFEKARRENIEKSDEYKSLEKKVNSRKDTQNK